MTIQHVAVYCRRSIDRDETAVSVGVQERACREYAAKHWPDVPVRAYVDNAVSAADASVVRPEYERLVEAIRAGTVAAVVVREQSRLTRQVEQWEAICRSLQVAGIEAVHQTQGGPVAVTEGSRLPGRIMSLVDAEYVEQVKVKTRATLRDNAKEGRPHGYPGYGFQAAKDKAGRAALEPNPDEVPVVRRIMRELASGSSLALVAAGLNDAGVPTPRGGVRWTPTTVRSIATAPRLIGKRVHKGHTTDATWKPLISQELFDQVQASIGKPRRTRSTRRRYLLSGGLAVCAECGTPLISHRYTLNGKTEPGYACPHKTRPDGGCGRCAILAKRLEEHVLTVVAGWLRDPAFVQAMNRHLAEGVADLAPLRAELAEVEQQLTVEAERWAAGELLELEHAAARRVLLDRRAAVLGDLDRQPVVEVLTGADVVKGWRLAAKAGDVERLRALIGLLAEPVVVARANRDGKRLAIAERAPVIPVWG